MFVMMENISQLERSLDTVTLRKTTSLFQMLEYWLKQLITLATRKFAIVERSVALLPMEIPHPMFPRPFLR